jgi:hypothetical protein
MKQADASVRFNQTALTAAVVFAALSVGASSGAKAQGLPSYATSEESIHGRIVSVDGTYRLQVRDDRGFTDNVRLHDGTVINPTGLRLAAGQSVTILGRANGKTFEANEIDTPYNSYYAAPVVPYGFAYPYAYAPYAYAPYGYYGYPYPLYGPRFGFGIGFRDRGFAFGGRF